MDKSENYQIKLGAVFSYISILLSILVGLIYTPWMISLLGRESYGLYVLASSLISFFLLDFGVGAAVTRFVSIYRAKNEYHKINEFMGVVSKLYLFIDLFIFIALSVCYLYLDDIYVKLSPAELKAFKVVFLIVASYSVISFPFACLTGVLNSFERFVFIKGIAIFNRTFILVAMSIALVLGYRLYALVAIHAVSGIICVLLRLWGVHKFTNIKVVFSGSSWTSVKEILGFSIFVTICSIAQRFIFNVTPSILGMTVGTEMVAIFGVAATIEGLFFTIANAINGMFLPKISRYVVEDDDTKKILLLMIKVGRFHLYTIGAMFIGFVSFGYEFLTKIWLNSEYEAAYRCIILLLIPSLIALPQQIAATTVIVKNKVKLQSYIFIGMAIINTVLSYCFSKYWGAFGACLSIFIAYSFRTFMMNVVYHRTLKLNMFTFFKESLIKMGWFFILMFFLGFGFNRIITLDNPAGFLLKTSLWSVCYIILAYRFVFNAYEKELFNFSKLIKKVSSRNK